MKSIIKIIPLTAFVVFGVDLYAEYCVSREIPVAVQLIATLAVGALIIFYFYFTVKQIIKLLKLNSK